MKNIDLSKGNIKKLVIQTAVPMVVAQLVSMLYNIVDRIFVGKIPQIGAVALGGIGIYLPINIIFMAVSLLFGGGGAPQAAIALGSGDRKKAEKYLGCCVIPLVASGVLFALCLFFGGEQILPLFGATRVNLEYSLEYVRVICIGVPFSMLITGLNIFINTQGKTMIGMVSVMLGAVVNIILDAVFILGMDMGVAGAAWATVIGQAASAVWVIGFLVSGRSAIRIRRCYLIPDLKLLWSIVSLGVSNFITTGAESIVNIILNYSMKKYGASVFTGYALDGATLAITAGTIVTTTSSFIRLPINGFSQGLQPVISYNYGAKKHDRVQQAVRFAILVTTVYAAALWLFMMAVPETFTRLFTDSADVVAVSGNLIRAYVFGMILSGVQSILIQSFVARGMKKYSLMVSFVCKGLYVPLLLILPAVVSPAHSVTAIYAAQAATDILATVFILVLYNRTKEVPAGDLRNEDSGKQKNRGH